MMADRQFVRVVEMHPQYLGFAADVEGTLALGRNIATSDDPLDFQSLSIRARMLCERMGLKTIRDLQFAKKRDLECQRNFGAATARELHYYLSGKGLRFAFDGLLYPLTRLRP